MSELTIELIDAAGQINLRGDASNAAFADAVQSVLGQPLPTAPNTVSHGEHRVCWLGPDEWLLVTAAGRTGGIVAELARALDGQHAAVNDLSGAYAVYRIEGDAVCELLARGCTLDLDQTIFPSGSCAQSGLAKANVLLIRCTGSNAFDIVVRRSFSDYVAAWLRQAGRDWPIAWR